VLGGCEPSFLVATRVRRPRSLSANPRLGIWLLIAVLGLASCALTEDPGVRLADPVARDVTEAVPAPGFTHNAFITTDGQQLPLRIWLPQGRIRAVILALHGFNDYSHAFDAPARIWAQDGIATYAYDQRGFGGAPERGRWLGRPALAIDAATACGILRHLYPHIPLYLLGESMGGAVAVLAMTGDSGAPVPDVDGVILAAPAVWGRSTMDFWPRAALFVGVRLAPGLTLTGQSLHIMASDNIPMLRALGRDPLVIKETRLDAIWGLVNLMDAALDSAPRLRVPLLLMYGARDEVIPKLPMRRFVEALPPDPRRRRNFAYYRHGYHMLLRDLEGPMVSADIAGWILTAGGPLFSGADRNAFVAELGATNRSSLAQQ
jgi:acylglycerol lipase